MNEDMIALYRFRLKHGYSVSIKEINNGVYILEAHNSGKKTTFLPDIEYFTIFELRPCPGQIYHVNPHIIEMKQFITPIMPLHYVNITFDITSKQHDDEADNE